jgi:hypothetical protein
MPRKVEVTFDEFGWEALADEAKRQDVTVEDLVKHAAMYYLSEADRERISHRVLRQHRAAAFASASHRFPTSVSLERYRGWVSIGADDGARIFGRRRGGWARPPKAARRTHRARQLDDRRGSES